jgi:hypothetical protein
LRPLKRGLILHRALAPGFSPGKIATDLYH